MLSAAIVLITPFARVPAGELADDFVLNLRQPLESRFARTMIAPNDEITGIVVLGGSMARVEEAIRLADVFPDARLILTGASRSEVARIEGQDYRADRLAIESAARNTFENAHFAKRIARPNAGERWLVVTSAMHMPRAIGTFVAAGFEVEPWPVWDAHPAKRYVAPLVRHELLGLVKYRALGRTERLFPKPSQRLSLARGAIPAGSAM